MPEPAVTQGTRATPTVYKGNVYTFSRDGTLLCLDAESGTVTWERNLSRERAAFQPSWGFAGSLVIWNDLLLINVNTAGMAVRRSNGETVWNSCPAAAGYATPVVATIGGQTQAIFFTESGLHGVEPATGEELWSYEWITGFGVNAADPLVFGDRVFLSSAYQSGCALLQVEGGDVETLRRNNLYESYFSSFVYDGGCVYGNSGTAEAEGIGSLIVINEYLVLLTERGRVTFAELTREGYRPVPEMHAPRGIYRAAPAFCDNRLFLRDTGGNLHCFERWKGTRQPVDP
jgi:outer membrane protein assembly factor BamB